MNSIGLVLLALFFTSLFLTEKIWPLRASKISWKKRLLPNLLLATTAYFISALVVRPLYLSSMEGAQAFKILSPILSFLALDLSFYYWHRLNHKASFLWRFHNCHHSDPALDSTTAFRFHPGEILMSSSLRLLQGAVIVSSYKVLFLHEISFQLCTFFHHSNLKLPKKVEKGLSFVLVTPKLHGIHHSNYKNETDSNFGVIFSLWDRIHGTYRERPAQSKIEIGVPGYSAPEDNKIRELLAAPFKKQKDYWTGRTKRPCE